MLLVRVTLPGPGAREHLVADRLVAVLVRGDGLLAYTEHSFFYIKGSSFLQGERLAHVLPRTPLWSVVKRFAGSAGPVAAVRLAEALVLPLAPRLFSDGVDPVPPEELPGLLSRYGSAREAGEYERTEKTWLHAQYLNTLMRVLRGLGVNFSYCMTGEGPGLLLGGIKKRCVIVPRREYPL